jgi:hypothetical protein
MMLASTKLLPSPVESTFTVAMLSEPSAPLETFQNQLIRSPVTNGVDDVLTLGSL